MEEKQESLTTGNIIFCNCGGDRIDRDLIRRVEEHLRGVSVMVTKLSDLCGLAVSQNKIVSDMTGSPGEYLVIGCYRRTMSMMIDRVTELSGSKNVFSHVNLIEMPFESVINQINNFCRGKRSNKGFTEMAEGSEWHAWYPVIDHTRCTVCGQCADFCLFGVYELTDKQINVVNPRACKNNCPACARICPATAIIFPKYAAGGAIGGSDKIDEYAEQHRQTADLETFLGSDVYEALQKRKSRRETIIRKEAMQRAVSERESALKGIKKN